MLKRNLLISHSRKTIMTSIPHSTNFEYIVCIINWNSPFGNLMNPYQTAKKFQLKEFLFETKCDFLTMSYQMTINYKIHCFTLVWNLRNVKRKLMCGLGFLLLFCVNAFVLMITRVEKINLSWIIPEKCHFKIKSSKKFLFMNLIDKYDQQRIKKHF